MSSEIQPSSGDIQITQADINQVKQDFQKQLDQIYKQFNKKIENKEVRVMEILAIFIALFTFVSVNITIFTRLTDLHAAVWFMCLITIFFSFFTSLLLLFLNPTGGYKKLFYTTIISCLALFVLLLLTSKGMDWNPKFNLDQPKTSSDTLTSSPSQVGDRTNAPIQMPTDLSIPELPLVNKR